MNDPITWTTAAALGLGSLPLAGLGWRRLELSRAKHPSLAGHSRMAQRLAAWLPGYSFDATRFFDADGAPPEVAARRRAGFEALSHTLGTRHADSLRATREARDGLPDLRFTGAYRVPFPFSALVRERLPVGAFVRAADGVMLEDLDGCRLHDLTGSYGVNLFGVDFYKDTIREAVDTAGPLGPVLGAYHPCVLDNVRRLQAISGLDDVSFHMSGTEAVMQAVRLARYHTKRRHLVRFCGAYHGWWEDVQPGPGNPLPPRETYTLRDQDERSLQVLATRRDIACVLVNPLQALHPNRAAPTDSALLAGRDGGAVDRAGYARWLQRLREVCTRRGIVLIVDEVFTGFRLAPGGAQQYFGVQADLVTYGKTLGGGLPVGVVCGRRGLMQRFRDERPADICFARGTFNAHPYVMAAMNAFLRRLDEPAVRASYDGLDERWAGRAARFDAAMAAAGVPLRAGHLSTIWTLRYGTPSRYHWMLQYYLRAEGIALPWTGTGRLIFNLRHGEEEFGDLLRRFATASRRMQDDGWWWCPPGAAERTLRRQALRELLRAGLGSLGAQRRT